MCGLWCVGLIYQYVLKSITFPWCRLLFNIINTNIATRGFQLPKRPLGLPTYWNAENCFCRACHPPEVPPLSSQPYFKRQRDSFALTIPSLHAMSSARRARPLQTAGALLRCDRHRRRGGTVRLSKPEKSQGFGPSAACDASLSLQVGGRGWGMIAVLHSSQLPSDSGLFFFFTPSFSSLGLSPLWVTESILLNHASVCVCVPMSRCSNTNVAKKKILKRTFAALHFFFFGCAVLFGWLSMHSASWPTLKLMTTFFCTLLETDTFILTPLCRSRWLKKKGQEDEYDWWNPSFVAVKLTSSS